MNEAIRRMRAVRARTEALVEGLTAEDMGAQAMPDASPAKWHLGHTTWFFETFVLGPSTPAYRPFEPAFRTLFNSYYDSVGPRPPRPERGLMTRPPLATVLAWRRHVDQALERLLAGDAAPPMLALGLAHEEQHQELMVTDLLALFARNPLEPSWQRRPPATEPLPAAGWNAWPGGIGAIGHDGAGFAFDNEGPRHQVLLAPYRLGRRPVTAGEWLAFMADDGYRRPLLWQDDGWAEVVANRWVAPEYWDFRDGEWTMLTPWGRRPVEAVAPVAHVSWWEADAFARWAGARLPSEAEWETAAEGLGGCGRVWEWTASAHRPYPGWRAPPGAMGEYNGKFMAGRFVLKGGCWATPPGHVRPSSRNFFPPSARWQITGLRLAGEGQ